jgi:hypothetical protein
VCSNLISVSLWKARVIESKWKKVVLSCQVLDFEVQLGHEALAVTHGAWIRLGFISSMVQHRMFGNYRG